MEEEEMVDDQEEGDQEAPEQAQGAAPTRARDWGRSVATTSGVAAGAAVLIKVVAISSTGVGGAALVCGAVVVATWGIRKKLSDRKEKVAEIKTSTKNCIDRLLQPEHCPTAGGQSLRLLYTFNSL